MSFYTFAADSPSRGASSPGGSSPDRDSPEPPAPKRRAPGVECIDLTESCDEDEDADTEAESPPAPASPRCVTPPLITLDSPRDSPASIASRSPFAEYAAQSSRLFGLSPPPPMSNPYSFPTMYAPPPPIFPPPAHSSYYPSFPSDLFSSDVPEFETLLSQIGLSYASAYRPSSSSEGSQPLPLLSRSRARPPSTSDESSNDTSNAIARFLNSSSP